MKFNYKKERGPKISHFWSPKESSYVKRKRKKKKRKKEEHRKIWILVWNSIELWFCMESCVFWTLVGISMVSKPKV